MPLFERWRAERDLRRRAGAYVRALFAEPEAAQVRWLADVGTRGDADHAAWELRYARCALGLLTAQRDALDDRTGSLVARAIERAFARDRRVSAATRAIAYRQFNVRLRAYGEVLTIRQGRATTLRLGETLLAFAGVGAAAKPGVAAAAGDLLAAELVAANALLQREFGAASLPENVPPSALRQADG